MNVSGNNKAKPAYLTLFCEIIILCKLKKGRFKNIFENREFLNLCSKKMPFLPLMPSI